eukprot:515869-Rhodomonas_salina.3
MEPRKILTPPRMYQGTPINKPPWLEPSCKSNPVLSPVFRNLVVALSYPGGNSYPGYPCIGESLVP